MGLVKGLFRSTGDAGASPANASGKTVLKYLSELISSILGPARIVDETSKAVVAGAEYEFMSVSGKGFLNEFMVLSPSTNFSVIITVDGTEILNKTYTEYLVITQIVKFLAAFEERDQDGNALGKYVTHFKNIGFDTSLSIKVKNNSGASITFNNLLSKYVIL